MIILTIGETSRRLTSSSAIDESRVTMLMRSLGADAQPPGVHVRIATPCVGLNLSAGEKCRIPGRSLRTVESVIVELWQQRGLDRRDFRSGQLVAFLHQVQDVLEPGSAVRPSVLARSRAMSAVAM